LVTSIGGRLRAERLRLEMSQEAFGLIAGVTKQAQINYEKDHRHPDSRYLASMAGSGVDVLYVITGQRSQSIQEMETLPPDERIMLDNFRHAPPAVQAGVKTTLGAFAPSNSRAKAD